MHIPEGISRLYAFAAPRTLAGADGAKPLTGRPARLRLRGALIGVHGSRHLFPSRRLAVIVPLQATDG